MKTLQFTKAAENAITSLNPSEQKKALMLLNMVAENITDQNLSGKVHKLSGLANNYFVIRFGLKLRIIVEIIEDKINVIDILNHDLYVRYFNNKGRIV